jgi:hypothetical protein
LTRRASGGCEAGALTAGIERFRSSKRSPLPRGEVEPIEGALDPSGGTSLAGVLSDGSWFRGLRHGTPIGAPRRAAAGVGRPAAAPRNDRGCQSLWRLGVGSPSWKARGVGGRSRARGRAGRPHAKLSRPKSRVIGNSARGANHLPFSRSRRRTVMPRDAASGAWGARWMKQASAVDGRNHRRASGALRRGRLGQPRSPSS